MTKLIRSFNNFKYFVERFITKLLKNGYERNNRLFYKPQKDGSGSLMGNWDGLYNKKNNLLYVFQINTRDMEWVMDYIETWKLSNKYTRKDKKTR